MIGSLLDMSKLYSRARTPPYPPPQTKFDRHSSSKNPPLPVSKDYSSKSYNYRECDKFDKYKDYDKYDASKYKQDRYDKVENYKVDKDLKDNLYGKYMFILSSGG